MDLTKQNEWAQIEPISRRRSWMSGLLQKATSEVWLRPRTQPALLGTAARAASMLGIVGCAAVLLYGKGQTQF